MPTLARPEVDVLEGLTTAIVVDQQRMGGDASLHGRHGDRCQRDAAHPLQPAREAPHRPATARSRSTSPRFGSRAARSRSSAPAARRKERRDLHACWAACAHVVRAGARSPTWTSLAALRRLQVARRGRAHHSRLHGGQLLCRSALPRVGHPRPGQADPQVHQEGTGRLPLIASRSK